MEGIIIQNLIIQSRSVLSSQISLTIVISQGLIILIIQNLTDYAISIILSCPHIEVYHI